MEKKLVKPVKEEILIKAIRVEGLARTAWGYKTPNCIWIYKDGQEKPDVWKDIKPSMSGWERGAWDFNELVEVNYYIFE